MNRILVTGLAIGTDPAINACNTCNYDLSWLFNNPSTLLWTDKLIITPEILTLIKESYFPDGDKNIGKAISLIFERLEDNNLIETKKASEVITKKIRDKIYDQIEFDRNRLASTFPNSVKIGKNNNVPGQLFINGEEFCAPSLWTMYASLLLAKEWNSDLLLPPRSHHYFDRALLRISEETQNKSKKHAAFDEIFKSKLPEQELLPQILIHPAVCTKCKYETLCSTDVFKKVESNVTDIMAWRSYDEVQELKSTINQISKLADNSSISTEEIISKFKETESKLNKSLRSVFPKVERWSKMATVLSIPAIVAGISTDSTTTATIGASIAGIATIADQYINILRSKYRWVGHKIGS